MAQSVLQLRTTAPSQHLAIKSAHTVLLLKTNALRVTLATNRLVTSPKVSALQMTLIVLKMTQSHLLALLPKNVSAMEALQHAKLFHAKPLLHLPIV